MNRPFGSWLTSSSAASLHLINGSEAGGVVLILSFQGKVYEEHRISKLIFSWPQVSCYDECPVRGSRVVFASYRDSLGQVQKFAMRFSSSSVSQTFIDSLKEGLKNVINVGITGSKSGSEMASASEIKSTKAIYIRPAEQLNNVNPVGSYEPPVKCISRHGSMNHTCSKEPVIDNSSEVTCAPLPSSFTSLLFESCTNVQEAPETIYLNNQMMR